MSAHYQGNHYPVAIIGGGQAGLSMSSSLKQRGIRHIIFEKHKAAHTWRTERWDTFCLVTPNWQCQLPGYPYRGDDPDGFMVRDEIIEYVQGFVKALDPPIREGVAVNGVRGTADGGFTIDTSYGRYTADQVVVATGGYQIPIVPPYAKNIDANVLQIHSSLYRSSEQLPDGAVLVVGSGQSGAQIAEDLHLAGRKVHLCVGDAPRVARRYRGKDVVKWLAEMGYYEMSVKEHPLRQGVRDNTNHYVTGRDGGRDIDLRKFAREGMELYGKLLGLNDDKFLVAEDLEQCLDNADKTSESIKNSIDAFITKNAIQAPVEPRYNPLWVPKAERSELDYRAAGITSIIWCIGFRADFSWIKLPAMDNRGAPVHDRGVTGVPGLYFLGLPWLHTWGSGRFSGIARDAEHLGGEIAAHADNPRKANPLCDALLGGNQASAA
ncbi:MSMEG_0569 family flavin-dependent oxidoreductase [Hyphomicrobium sp.]|jgi:putative flavoprotein involved in K+ transport|uniref:MSMEG_0569 family flavin-dependent oxidoreductase n=1 Tax=Hyphomicrobium sp. TaxID=82 RepID=UPI003568FE95